MSSGTIFSQRVPAGIRQPNWKTCEKKYSETKNTVLVHGLLQQQFLEEIRAYKNLNNAHMEYILQKPVKVEVLESLFKGDEVCRIAVWT